MLITETDFNDFAAQGYTRVPMMREVLADLDTPLSTYMKLASGPHSFLFESVQGGEKWGRYSIIGLPCRTRLRIRGRTLRIETDGGPTETQVVDDPLRSVREFHARFSVPHIDGLPRFTGGLVGYFGYDTVRYIEPHLGECLYVKQEAAYDILLLVSDEVVVFDNLAGRLYVIVHVDPSAPDAWAQGNRRLDELTALLDQPRAKREQAQAKCAVTEDAFRPAFERSKFEAAVERAREYIFNGDIFQVVLSQRLSIPFEADPLDLYRALRTFNPSPYMYYLDLGGYQIVGSSPEILVRLEDGELTVRPIAGTRRRGHTEEEDTALALELLSDPKEQAEHVMLVDLGRNDVGRVAKIGSVRLTEKMTVERYSHVMHIVSNVVGDLRDGLDACDVLRATFPAGTVSGAPKVRAMEIIDELEPTRRGLYAGAVGYFDLHGNLDLCIAIRTLLLKNGRAHLGVGAGIVNDSVPAKEYEETMNKGKALLLALKRAERGLEV